MSPEFERTPQEKNQLALEQILYRLLVGGVMLSSVLMLLGLLAGWISGAGIPDALPALQEVLPLALRFQPGGLLALGLLVLIATPILRVVGSVIGFLIERDYRYALITFIVLLIVLSSILLGEE